MKILLPIDGSPSSSRAVRHVARHWAEQKGARSASLVLVHVDLVLPERVARYLAAADIARFHEENAKRALAPARRILRAMDMPHEEKHEIGDPATVIIDLASKIRCDMVAMGSHGHGALMSLVLGSVVMKVLSHSKAPVLVVR